MAEKGRKPDPGYGDLDWLSAPRVMDVSSGVVHRLGLVDILANRAVPGPNGPSRSDAASMLHSLYAPALVKYTIKARGEKEAPAHRFVEEYFVRVVAEPKLLAGYHDTKGPFGNYILRSYRFHLYDMYRENDGAVRLPGSERKSLDDVAEAIDDSKWGKLDPDKKPVDRDLPTPEEELTFKRDVRDGIIERVFASARRRMKEESDVVGPFVLDALLDAIREGRNPLRPGVGEIAERAGVSGRTVSSRLAEIRVGIKRDLESIILTAPGVVAEGALPEDLLRRFLDELGQG